MISMEVVAGTTDWDESLEGNTFVVDARDDDDDDDHSEDSVPWQSHSPSIRRTRHSRFLRVAITIVTALTIMTVFVVGMARSNHKSARGSSPNDSVPNSSPSEEVPLTAPSSSPPPPTTVEDSAETASCLNLYQCHTEHPDRFGHGVPLLVGYALCNAQFRFGLTPSGILQWHDCDTSEIKLVYGDAAPNTVAYFSMSSTGTFMLMDQSDAILWKKEPLVKITFSKQCLPNPLLDCPYLHLHKNGDVVLNSRDDQTRVWSDRKIERTFDDLFH